MFVMWFSAIMGYGPNANRTNARLVFTLADESMNGGNYNYWLDTPGATGLGVTLGRFTSSKFAATQVRDSSFGDGTAGNPLALVRPWSGFSVQLSRTCAILGTVSDERRTVSPSIFASAGA